MDDENDLVLTEVINGTAVQVAEDETSPGLVAALGAADEQSRRNMVTMMIILEAIEQLEDGGAGPLVIVPDPIREKFKKVLKV